MTPGLSEMHTLRCIAAVSMSLLIVACSGDYDVLAGADLIGGNAAKADGADNRQYEILLTDPHCDVCTSADKSYLKANSSIARRAIELIDGARTSVDVAQFTFSRKDIEAALVNAHARGVRVRLAMNVAQNKSGTVSRRLADGGLAVEFVSGKSNGQYAGLQHAKYMVVDGHSLLTGSNNWSSTGTSINEENTIIMHADPGDSLITAFNCNFEALFAHDLERGAACSNDEVKFTPGSAQVGVLKEALRNAETRVDVLMHHLVFSDLVKVLAQTAERGVQVRVIVNAADKDEVQGGKWVRFYQAGGMVRFKRSNGELYQLMHHKLAIVDGEVLYNGSGNWSGSAFFNNSEFYIRYDDDRVVAPFDAMFARLWDWSLTGAALDGGLTPAEQHASEHQVFFGNLHAHHAAGHAGELLDDGVLERHDEHGETVDVHEESNGDPARFAFEYARDQGGLDFMAITPHCTGDEPDQPKDMANMSTHVFEQLVHLAEAVTDESGGTFVAIPGMEWNTNSQGNHVTVIGSRELAKINKGRFDQFYGDFLPERASAGDRPLIGFNHPRTFRHHVETLQGNWDQVFDVKLTDIPKNGQRKVKFNDFGIDDYSPLREVHGAWIDGAMLPDRATVTQALLNVEAASRPYLRFMEVLVGRGKEIRHELGQNPSLSEDSETGEITRYTRVHSDWDYYLLHGFRLAPTAPHDNHYANWGTGHTSRTGVLATALTERHIMDALDRRAAYASEDPNLSVKVYAGDRVPMGGELRTLDSSVTLTALLSDPDYSGGYEITVYMGTIGGSEVRQVAATTASGGDWAQIDVALPGQGRHFIYLEIDETGADRMAWSSPIWVEQLSSSD